MRKGIIIGAGIGGLTTSIALAQRGIATEVYEQAPALGEVGAGLWVAPNGLKVYQRLGLSEAILRSGKPLRKISVVDRDYKAISVIDGDERAKAHGFRTVAIHRAELHRLLVAKVDPVSIHLGKKFVAIDSRPDHVSVRFADGTSAVADFVICADGLNSVGRRLLHPKVTLRYSGQTCWRFVTDYALPEAEDDDMYEVWSEQKGLRVGYSKINARQIYVFITAFTPAGGVSERGRVKADLLQLCAAFPEPIKAMINACDPDRILRNDLFDFKPFAGWTRGNVALLGDAAHATTPNLGQGACQAIEDAWVIAKMLSSHDDVSEAFRRYEALRGPKAAFITRTSHLFSTITNTSGAMKALLTFLIRLTPPRVNQKQIDRIYTVTD